MANMGWSRRRVVFLAVTASAWGALLVATREVLLPFVVALVVAYVLAPLVALCERYRIPRSVSILVVYAVVLGSLYGAVATLAPRLYRETAGLLREAPTQLKRTSEVLGPRVDGWVARIAGQAPDTIAPEAGGPRAALEVKRHGDGSYAVEVGSGFEIVQVESNRFRVERLDQNEVQGLGFSQFLQGATDQVVDYAKKNLFQLLKVGRAILAYASRGIFLLFMTLMVAGYLMHTRESVIGFFRDLVPSDSRLSFERLLFRIDRGLAGVVRGQLLICLVNGILSALGFWMLGLKYWPVFSLVAALGSIIPIFGSILSTIPAVLVGLTQDIWTALWVLLWVLLIHQIEANLLNPKIIGTAARIHPCLVVFSLIVGEHFFGMWGALLAVPALSILQSIFLHARSLAIPDVTDSLLPLFEAKRASVPPRTPLEPEPGTKGSP